MSKLPSPGEPASPSGCPVASLPPIPLALVEKLQKATEAEQHIYIYDAIKLCEERGWISPATAGRAMAHRANGALVDAVLLLVPDGYAVTDMVVWPGTPSEATILETRLERFGLERKLSYVHGGGARGRWEASAQTLPLALCIAALKARGMEAEGGDAPSAAPGEARQTDGRASDRLAQTGES